MIALSTLMALHAAAAPVDCQVDDHSAGQRQVWVPGCKGPGCKANSLDNDCAWCVYDMDLCESKYGSPCRTVSEARAAQNTICHHVKKTSFQVQGYGCAGNETLLYYPEGKGPFPVVVYAHGMGAGAEVAGVDARGHSLDAIATHGFVVIAPFTGGYDGGVTCEKVTLANGSIVENCTTIPAEEVTCSSKLEYKDVIKALSSAKDSSALQNLGLSNDAVDWSSVGVWGFSMGGKTIPKAAQEPDQNIRAMVAEHGARSSRHVTVPSLYLTSSKDTSSSPPDVMRAEFDKNHAKSKVFADYAGYIHEEPILSGLMDIWIAKFLSCHLGSDLSSPDCCDVYGDGPNSLCNYLNYDECIRKVADGVTASCPSAAQAFLV